ncbi:ATP-dependent DNA helicase [Caerostris darwini]|uniref:ATP-dependent DNA helicase n=1 Tax=Caerostris darwini TaxID=1538125 RepID=A0AAV4NHK0_9ARAC|nr:ATP-dependent DNA helicase [Caerostris darwini]
MIRENEDNYILKCRQLFNQCFADMYAKIETERLILIRLKQVKLRSEDYFHLRDAFVNDCNTTNVGRLTILPSSYTGSPCHMHEYVQDTIPYVRHCYPIWNYGFMVMHEVSASLPCWIYSVEWQMRGLPHAHILIWLYNKITSNEIDDVICAEIPNAQVDRICMMLGRKI